MKSVKYWMFISGCLRLNRSLAVKGEMDEFEILLGWGMMGVSHCIASGTESENKDNGDRGAVAESYIRHA